MLQFIENLDIYFFRVINSGWSNSAFDSFFPFITELENWLLLYIFAFLWMIFKGGTRGRLAAAALILTVLVTDQVNNQWLKDIFDRIRPCRALEDVNLLISCGTGKAFPSGHAANNFAAAIVFSHFYRKYSLAFFTIAVVISLSRIYCGVHYPFDTIGGAFVGIVLGSLIVLLFKYPEKKWLKQKETFSAAKNNKQPG
ncbi:MAG: phosphatase PAP2 family protein [Candidatus Kapaibacterium sp.]